MKSREPSKDELARRRNLRLARVRKAEKLNCAIGHIGPDLQLLTPNPPQLSKRPKDAA